MNYQDFKQAVIQAAEAKQVKDYELYYSESAETQTEIFKTEVKGFNTSSRLGVCFKCLVDGKMGYASTEHLSEEEAVSLVERALENAKSIESEEQAFIHTKGDTYAVLPKEEAKLPTAAELIDFSMSLQNQLYATDNRVVDGTQAYAGFVESKSALYNSNGLDLEDSAAFSFTYGMAVVADNGEMYDGMEVASGKFDSFNVEKIAKEAVKDAVDTIGAESVPSGKYPVVFSNKVMASMLSTYASVFSAEAAQKGLSLLKDKEGEQIAADIVTLTDDPMKEDALVKATFDDEGVATYKKNVIEGGQFVTLLHNLKTAAAAGVKTTGNGHKASYASNVGIRPYSFYINPVKGSLDDLMAEAGNGIYITSVEGMHAGANAVTGDFSLAASGFCIEDGKKGRPVKSITVSGNFFTLLKEIARIGEDLKFNPFALGSSRCGSPSVLIKEMTIAGK
ncbi:MAG: TldD/PmbA family protein [Lachnospiraceae bacterium]|nr:TldD/PmbA family protein [Lachnospiraceae bacterium]